MATDSLAYQQVFNPVLQKVTEADKNAVSAAETLRSALNKAEQTRPGWLLDFLTALVEADNAPSDVKAKLAKLKKPDVAVSDDIAHVRQLGKHLVDILTNIRVQIRDKPKFVAAIKEIAVAIKDFLDAVTDVAAKNKNLKNNKKALEEHKKAFIKTSKTFSDTLKAYFKDDKQEPVVFSSADTLIKETTTIMDLLLQK
eukprot:Opistho-1_new@52470